MSGKHIPEKLTYRPDEVCALFGVDARLVREIHLSADQSYIEMVKVEFVDGKRRYMIDKKSGELLTYRVGLGRDI